MLTMLYDAETLEPELLIEEDIKNGDFGREFFVINGFWRGTFNGVGIVIHSPYGDKTPSTVYKCYKFKYPPPDTYIKLSELSGEIGNLCQYSAWFAHYRDLLEAGEIQK